MAQASPSPSGPSEAVGTALPTGQGLVVGPQQPAAQHMGDLGPALLAPPSLSFLLVPRKCIPAHLGFSDPSLGRSQCPWKHLPSSGDLGPGGPTGSPCYALNCVPVLNPNRPQGKGIWRWAFGVLRFGGGRQGGTS